MINGSDWSANLDSEDLKDSEDLFASFDQVFNLLSNGIHISFG